CLFLRAEDGIRDRNVTGVQTCALPIFFDSADSIRRLSAPDGCTGIPSALPPCIRGNNTLQTLPHPRARQKAGRTPAPHGGKCTEIGRASCRQRVSLGTRPRR